MIVRTIEIGKHAVQIKWSLLLMKKLYAVFFNRKLDSSLQNIKITCKLIKTDTINILVFLTIT